MPASDIDIGGNHIGEKYPGALTTFDDDHGQYNVGDHDDLYKYDHEQDIYYQYEYQHDGDENGNFPEVHNSAF